MTSKAQTSALQKAADRARTTKLTSKPEAKKASPTKKGGSVKKVSVPKVVTRRDAAMAFSADHITRLVYAALEPISISTLPANSGMQTYGNVVQSTRGAKLKLNPRFYVDSTLRALIGQLLLDVESALEVFYTSGFAAKKAGPVVIDAAFLTGLCDGTTEGLTAQQKLAINLVQDARLQGDASAFARVLAGDKHLRNNIRSQIDKTGKASDISIDVSKALFMSFVQVMKNYACFLGKIVASSGTTRVTLNGFSLLVFMLESGVKDEDAIFTYVKDMNDKIWLADSEAKKKRTSKPAAEKSKTKKVTKAEAEEEEAEEESAEEEEAEEEEAEEEEAEEESAEEEEAEGEESPEEEVPLKKSIPSKRK